MGKKKKQKDEEEIEGEKPESRPSKGLDAEVGDERERDDSGAGGKQETKGVSWIKGKWLYGLLILILIAGISAGLYFKQDLMGIVKGKKQAVVTVGLTDPGLFEENLSPFYIPSSAGQSRSAVRVDLTVVWDSLAAMRYKTNELKVRDETYEYLKKALAVAMDLNGQRSALEEGITGVFRVSLGAINLTIRIKELKEL